MVDRIAALICHELMDLNAAQRSSFVFPDDANGDTIDRSISAAMTVIRAMRDPSEEMEAVMQGAKAENGRELYRMAIDAALLA